MGFETVGNAYAFLALCCKACGVGLAHTQAEIEAMPNGAELLSVYTENDIETYRDVLVLCGTGAGRVFLHQPSGKAGAAEVWECACGDGVRQAALLQQLFRFHHPVYRSQLHEYQDPDG